MGKPAARQGDQIVATDTHIVLVPSETGPRPVPMPHSFVGGLSGNLSGSVRINGRFAATVGSTARNTPPHIPTPPGTAFQVPPTNMGTVLSGSGRVMINGRPAARQGDRVQTCADPAPNMSGQLVVMGSTVMIGD